MIAVGIAFCSVTAPARANEIVHACGGYPNSVFATSSRYGISASGGCPMSLSASSGTWSAGQGAILQAVAPAGLAIVGADIPSNGLYTGYVNDGYGWGGDFYWGGGRSNITSGSNALLVGNFASQDFGVLLACNQKTCSSAHAPGQIAISNIELTVGETVSPSFTSAGGLWQAPGWVRGAWPLTFSADSPAGVCSLSASFAGAALIAPAAAAPAPQSWHQCSAPALDDSVATTDYPQGADQLQINALDAAGQPASSTKTIYIDNQAPTVSLTGPSDALSTAGTQYVTATVGAGPSGAYGAQCSVDGGPSTFYRGVTAQIPVSGIGAHRVSCVAENNAVSASGQRAVSAPASFGLTIRQPTVEAITFSHIADQLRCHAVTERVKVRGHRRVVRRHGKTIVIGGRLHRVKRRVRRCHARTIRRRVYVVLKRHGKAVRRHGRVVRVHRTRRVVVLPHRVYKPIRHLGHGQHTTVSGFLGLSDGTALAGRTVTVLGAPNTGSPQFAPVASAQTNADGVWVAKIPAGPSRLLEAVYGGDTTTEPATSTTVRTIVPAKIRILQVPTRAAWGGTVTFKGRLYGGYIPPEGLNVRLRYGYRHALTTYGVRTHVRGDGHFATSFTFGAGDPRDHIRFAFQFSTLPANYPFAEAHSNTVTILVGGHPRVVVRHRHHKRRAHHHPLRHRHRKPRHHAKHHRHHHGKRHHKKK